MGFMQTVTNRKTAHVWSMPRQRYSKHCSGIHKINYPSIRSLLFYIFGNFQRKRDFPQSPEYSARADSIPGTHSHSVLQGYFTVHPPVKSVFPAECVNDKISVIKNFSPVYGTCQFNWTSSSFYCPFCQVHHRFQYCRIRVHKGKTTSTEYFACYHIPYNRPAEKETPGTNDNYFRSF